ncbi:hypothetical protein ACEXAJ_07410 [Fusobacterium necrophorum subsp. funduliforme]
MNLDNIERARILIDNIKRVDDEFEFLKKVMTTEYGISTNTDFEKAIYILKNSFEKEEERKDFLGKLLELKRKQFFNYKTELELM